MTSGCCGWTPLGALTPALLAHGRPSPLAPVLGVAFPSTPIRNERSSTFSSNLTIRRHIHG
jgi:hypothetical protein